MAASLNGSFGLIIADWKTLPHHPAFCFSWPGIILTLGLAWNCTVHEVSKTFRFVNYDCLSNFSLKNFIDKVFSQMRSLIGTLFEKSLNIVFQEVSSINYASQIGLSPEFFTSFFFFNRQIFFNWKGALLLIIKGMFQVVLAIF